MDYLEIAAIERARTDRHSIEIIQVLRGIAALMVVIFHASRFISPYYSGLGWRLFGGGSAMGVDMFFVISGFIMVYTTTGAARVTVKGFLAKRFLRIWPPYVVITLVYIVVSGTLQNYFSSSVDAGRLFNSFTFIPVARDQLPALSVGWTLNFEMYFYLVFGLSMYFGKARWVFFFSWIMFSLLMLPLAVGRAITLDGNKDYAFSIPYLNLATSPLIWLFAAGVAIGLLYRSNLKFTNPFYAKVCVFATTVVVTWQYCALFRVIHGISHAGIFVIPLIFVIVVASKTIDFPVPKWAAFLGDISFSLYLVHPLVQERLEALFVSAGLRPFATGIAFVLLTTCLAVCVAAISHRYLEQGLSGWFKSKFASVLPLQASVGSG